MTAAERILAGQTRAWLPPSALEGGIVEPLLGRVVERWSTDWFAGARLKIASRPGRFEQTSQGWDFSADGVGVPRDDKTAAAIGGLLLGSDLRLEALTVPDQKVVREWTARCLKQLGEQLAEACGVTVAQTWQSDPASELSTAWSLGVGRGAGKPSFSVLLAEDLLIRLIRQAAPSSLTMAKLVSPMAGADLQQLSLTAFLGRCRLSLGELSSLEAGDVLCLDALAAEPVALAIEHVPSTATCTIEQDGPALTLRLVE